MKSEIQKQTQEGPQGHILGKIQHYLRLRYPMEIIEDEDGVVATIPDLPGCASFGDTIQDAVRSLSETKELWIKGRVESGLPVPEPTEIEDFSGKFVLRIPRGLHRSLDREARKQGVSLNQYILHLLSERHALMKAEEVLGQVQPILASISRCYEHGPDFWVQPAEVNLSIFAGPDQTVDSTESLLGMLDYLPRPKGFRTLSKSNELKDLKAMYVGKP
jgi:antitoxin HicB